MSSDQPYVYEIRPGTIGVARSGTIGTGNLTPQLGLQGTHDTVTLVIDRNADPATVPPPLNGDHSLNGLGLPYRMTLRILLSYDGGNTWPGRRERVIHAGGSEQESVFSVTVGETGNVMRMVRAEMDTPVTVAVAGSMTLS